MVQNNLSLKHLMIHYPTSSDVGSEEAGEQMNERSGAQQSKWTNGQVNGPVRTPGFLVVLDHSVLDA